jgi:hypothetical protein
MAPIDQGFDDTPQQQPSISQRALAVANNGNGRGPPRSNGAMRY